MGFDGGHAGARPRFLMASPDHYRALHFLNPWMTYREDTDPAAAMRQWSSLREALISAGADVEVVSGVPHAPAMTFTRDAAIVVGDRRAVVLRNGGWRGDTEPGPIRRRLRRLGFDVDRTRRRDVLEGGNLLRRTEGGHLVGIAGSAPTAPIERLAALAEPEAGPWIGVGLLGRRHLHLDTALADLGGRGWLAYPDALAGWDEDPAWSDVLGGAPVIEVDDDQAASLACNVVVVGTTVIGGGLDARLRRRIGGLGLDVIDLDLDEFRKAGGGAHCLTLELDPPAMKGAPVP